MVRRILVPEGAAVPAFTVLALIGAATDPLPTIDPYYRVTGRRQASEASAIRAEAPRPASESAQAGDRVSASPRARKRAADNGVDLSTIAGTGPGGRIVEADVRLAASLRP